MKRVSAEKEREGIEEGKRSHFEKVEGKGKGRRKERGGKGMNVE